MSKEQIGKIVTCDRCGNKIFLRFTGETVLDGGLTKIDNFERLPPEWHWMSEYGYLCDSCMYEFRNHIHNFLGDDVAPAWKHPIESTPLTGTYVQMIEKENENET